ncbi:RsmE family RNA methyltransferase [Desulfurispira natronophila]|uniref:Ribosomal RNA small subunit methyltransferase E n=1 Tax=Desulfurispira natronophila TaxID=682562 RepID=A0A7W7Y2X9_9BACT|nr:RsmE family RNA methyltransferase [Desulfurispira natronophila]MBB5021116.1 16S rRNA (uracil1498-N3)-methyltransferase [Desulfurispira natronophila]
MAFLVASEQIDGNVCYIRGEELHHLRTVLRRQTGDPVDIICRSGTRYDGTIRALERHEAEITLQNGRPHNVESPLDVTMACATSKGDILMESARMFCELGVTGIVAFDAHNSTVRYDQRRWERKQLKLQRIVEQSCKQNLRTCVPRIHCLHTFESLFTDSWQEHQKIIFHECATTPLAQIAIDPQQPILLLVGPEGGFSSEEIAMASRHGAAIASMGPRVLKVSTAHIAALVMVQHRFGDVGS